MAGGLFGGGNGNPATPYLVEDGADLYAVGNALGKTYKQVANVDLNAYANWIPMGTQAIPFSGVYDGGGFGVSNLKMNTPSSIHAGLFGYSTGQILNVNILSGNMQTGTSGSSTHYFGAIVGLSTTPIKNCSNGATFFYKSTSTNPMYIGGVIGSGDAVDCFNTGNISCEYANLYGVNGSGSATRCYNTGNITNPHYGATGVSGGNATDCYNTGIISCTMNNQAFSGTAVGVCRGLATRCYNTGLVTSWHDSYGISSSSQAALDCYNAGEIVSTQKIAEGIADNATRCYNTGIIRGFNGGYGICRGIAKNCYSLGASINRVSGSSNTTAWAKVTPDTSVNTVGNYALDTMELIYE